MRFRAVAVMLGLVAACGDSIAPPDAEVPIDAPAGRVSVRYTPGEQAPTVQVLFQNADSSLVLATHTGPDGTANAYMAPGGFVTIVADSSFQWSIYTWAGVQPGDELLFGDFGFEPPGTRNPTFQLFIPEDPAQSSFQLLTACGTFNLLFPGGTQLVQLNSCADNHDLLVVSRDFQFGNEHYLYAPKVALDGSRVDLAGPWKPFDTARVEVAGMPEPVRELNVTMSLLDDRHDVLSSHRGGLITLAGGGGAADFGMTLPTGASSLVQLSPGFQLDVIGSMRAMHWGPAQATTRFDLSQRRLRAYREFPTYIAAQNAIHWSETGPGEAPDAVMAQFSWRGPDFETRNWVIVAPGDDEATVRFPRLPIAELMPGSDATIFQPSTLTTFRLDSGGYARVKRALPITWGSGFAWPMDTAEGTVVVQELGSPQFPD